MEFEKSTPATAEDVTRSEIPHMTITPVHGSIEPNTVNLAVDNEARQSFSFESESTASLAAENKPKKQSHAVLIIGLTLAVIAIIAAVALFMYLPR